MEDFREYDLETYAEFMVKNEMFVPDEDGYLFFVPLRAAWNMFSDRINLFTKEKECK